MTSVPKNSLAALFEGYGAPPPHSAFGSNLASLLGSPTILGAETPSGAAQDLGLFGVSTLFGHNQPPLPTLPYNWYYVVPRFTRFLSNLAVSEKHREAGLKKYNNVIASLNRRYYDVNSDTLNGIVIGSWGKGTQIAPPRDVDALFLLPDHVYHRFQQRSGNRQSQLLQDVKDALLTTNPRTIMRADRQVVIVPFDAVTVEVSVGFRCSNGSIIVCDSKGDGRYIMSTALAETADLDASDRAWNGNTRALIRMLKCWQDNCSVPIKSFVIERLAQDFQLTWQFHQQGVFFYDWMVRDFFAYLIANANRYVVMPGGEIVQLGSDWLSRAQTAYRNAVNACLNERENYQWLAGEDWQKIFGSTIPEGVL